MDEIKDFRGSTPVITRQAEDAARARLLRAMREPAPAPRRRLTPRPVWRLAFAASLSVAVAVGGGIALTGDDGGRSVLIPVASVQQLGERAARAAATNPYETVPSPGKWLYVKETIAPLREEPEPEVDRSKRTTLELWNSVDGRQTALDDGKGRLVIHEAGPGVTAADLAEGPVTPERVLARIRAAVAETPAPPGDDGPDEQRIVETISRVMNEQALEPEVRAALFRALPMIEGVSVKQDAVDAAGRHGVAFAYTGRWERFEIILNPEEYTYLGTYGETVATRTYTTPAGTREVKAGTPVVWTAHLRAGIVDEPGERP
ncbi:CU044_5270 family protein [Streptosporangium sandarakinum]|uniref:CU044_5270 family protein n=1 Tax=Streptosporangium sandarakinum TaxID=1260955 RepID=UPI0033A4B309